MNIGSIVNIKDYGAMGNGAHDDIAAIISALALVTTSTLIYSPPGSYIITSTIAVPQHALITGQAWPQFVAPGPYIYTTYGYHFIHHELHVKRPGRIYKDLQSNYTINRTWVTFGDSGYPARLSNSYRRDDCGQATDYEYHNTPQSVSKNEIAVSNPKIVIIKALPTISVLQNTLPSKLVDLNLGQWSGPSGDLVQIRSMPAFMIKQATTAMTIIKEVREKEAKQKKLT
ncbi:hypothetical protein B0O99DRAFT_597968 [Bisporella sp. PMI_857]|nr:hypothetical protein B0O99DRAFT_597968 [Bisporella sp. PMI_857]